MCLGAAIGGVASIAQGALGASAANKAADAQTAAVQQQLALQREMYDQTRTDLAPYREAGIPAIGGANYLLGLGPAPTWEDADGNQQTYSFQTSPGYEFARDENLDAVESSAAARGGLYSGAAMQALGERANQLANLEFGNNFNRVMSVAGLGANAAAQQGNFNMANAQMGSTSYANMGDAQAAGAIGAANSWGNALGTIPGLFNYQNALGAYSQPAAPAAANQTMRPIMRPF